MHYIASNNILSLRSTGFENYLQNNYKHLFLFIFFKQLTHHFFVIRSNAFIHMK